jgi:hypothetical protein
VQTQTIFYSLFLSVVTSVTCFGQQGGAMRNLLAQNTSKIPVQSLSTASPLHVDTNLFVLTDNLEVRRSKQVVLGISKKGKPIEAYFFPGKSDKKALVIGGMHGSELSSITIAKELITKLQTDPSNYYSVIIIPSLFPDNAAAAIQSPAQIGSPNNIGRYSDANKPDPNRQMPPLGKAFNKKAPFDFVGRTIEKENQLLLQLIQTYKPDRILNIHAIKDIRKAGVFADPRTEANGTAIGFKTDSSLAVAMASAIEAEGGRAPGNQLSFKPTAMYHSDHRAVCAGAIQKRNFMGSLLPNQRGYGTSLGSWATTAVEDSEYSRNAIRLLTMEFPGCKRPEDYTDANLQAWCQKEVDRYTASILSVFLQNVFEE